MNLPHGVTTDDRPGVVDRRLRPVRRRGIQADLKSFAAHGAYGMAAIASLTAQNTRGVQRVFTPPAEFLAQQLDGDQRRHHGRCGQDRDARHRRQHRRRRGLADRHRPAFVVLDPVMVATSGDRLLDPDAEQAMRALLPLADVITPNLAELAVLVNETPRGRPGRRDRPGTPTGRPDRGQGAGQGRPPADADDLRAESGRRAGTATDALVDPDGSHVLLPGPWIRTNNTHGTGCSLSSALAALRPQRDSWAAAAADAKAWLSGALAASDQLDVGSGPGPSITCITCGRPTARAFSAQMWAQIAPIREAIETMPFIRRLADGTLALAELPLLPGAGRLLPAGYARCLARVAALAPDQDAQEFFAHASAGALAAELTLHRSLLERHTAKPLPELRSRRSPRPTSTTCTGPARPGTTRKQSPPCCPASGCTSTSASCSRP